MTKQDRHLTTTQLSALIDGQLFPEEQRQSDAHLHTCEQCQQELEDLRQTVTLLRAMPQPVLPRSFALPADPVVTPMAARSARTLTPVAPPTPLRRNARSSYIRSTINAISTLAAMVGIVLLLTSMFGILAHSRSSTTSSGSASTNRQSPANAPYNVTTPVVPGVRTPNVQRTIPPAATNAPSMHRTDQNDNNKPNIFQSILTTLNPATSSGQAILGAILLAIGIIGFALVRYRAQAP